MRPVRAFLARACLHLYPRAWRDRYADEVLLLVDDVDAGIGDLADLAIGGLRRRADELHGGAPMPSSIRSASVVLAALVALPTAAFIGVQLVTFGLRAELLARTYYESQNKPVYVIREIRQTADVAHATHE